VFVPPAPRRGKTDMPQNAAFLSAINNAKRSIFIQTQNMNAEPIIEPLLNAIRRGIVVTVYLCLGYNDAGQLLPFQNGTNEMNAHRLYRSLQTDEEKARLHVYYYVAKDQTKPIHDNFRTRSCHVKLMIIDESVAIQGRSKYSIRKQCSFILPVPFPIVFWWKIKSLICVAI
jgi:phosphatidylserine/phosphatidylglycerophosphate/cardiolipin synthase-like enzyme